MGADINWNIPLYYGWTFFIRKACFGIDTTKGADGEDISKSSKPTLAPDPDFLLQEEAPKDPYVDTLELVPDFRSSIENQHKSLLLSDDTDDQDAIFNLCPT